MDKIYNHYEIWEDYQAGMYNDSDCQDKDKKVFLSVELLSNEKRFRDVCISILENWKVASDENLSNTGMNRRAWLGAAACMYNHGCPEWLTRIAWSLLNKEIQFKANNVAEQIINIYERKNKELHSGMGRQVLF